MTPSYQQAKAHVQTLPEDQRDAYLQRVWAYKHEVELAGMPWSVLTYAAYLVGFGLIMLARELPGPDWVGLGGGVFVLLVSMPLQRAAVAKKRAFQQAHPFKA
jgi:hypothetical protein